MIIVIAYSIAVTFILLYVLITDRADRNRMIDLLAAKDYADFKNFEDKPEGVSPRKSMIAAREAKNARKAHGE